MISSEGVARPLAQRLPIWDLLAWMSTCTKARAIGIEALKTRKIWLPEIDPACTYKELKLIYLLAFGKPRRIYHEKLNGISDIDMGATCVWKLSREEVVLHRGREIMAGQVAQTSVRFPEPATVGSRRRVCAFTCGAEEFALVSAGWVGLVPLANPNFVALADASICSTLDRTTNPQNLALLCQTPGGFAIRWCDLPPVLAGGAPHWHELATTADAVPEGLEIANYRLDFPERNLLVVYVWGRHEGKSTRLEAARLNLNTQAWAIPDGGARIYEPPPQSLEGSSVVGETLPYDFEVADHQLRVHVERGPFWPVMRGFSSSYLSGDTPVDSLHVLSCGSTPLFFLRYLGRGDHCAEGILLEKSDEPHDLETAIRAGAPIQVVEGLLPDHSVLKVDGQDRETFFKLRGEMIESYKRALNLALYAKRPDLVSALMGPMAEVCHQSDLSWSLATACSLGDLESVQAILASGKLAIAIPESYGEYDFPMNRVERWPLRQGIQDAMQEGQWQVVTHLLNYFQDPGEAHDLARRAIIPWFHDACENQVPGNRAAACELLRRLILLGTGIDSWDWTVEIAKRIGFWGEPWRAHLPIDLAAEWTGDLKVWGKACKAKHSVCWRLLNKLSRDDMDDERQQLIGAWLKVPLSFGVEAGLTALLAPDEKRRKKENE